MENLNFTLSKETAENILSGGESSLILFSTVRKDSKINPLTNVRVKIEEEVKFLK